ncbi:hypothetical protein PIIN_00211 [Serendipita indica DSM 11827]|uniref:Uncharacterized protein n=1 Tax=Serendipita indica (strain DSM 11827) TaxID=1109443 RepID=G4T5D4_SERID|nr:hypothetical protein PIIN_00211 [Serendipita indica DSM 11827]
MNSRSTSLARSLGDLALLASFPLLVLRIRKQGTSGISAATQWLHMIVFSLRYADVGSNISEAPVDYEMASSLLCQSFMQVALVLSTLTILVILSQAQKANVSQCGCRKNFIAIVKECCKYLIPAFLVAYRFNHTSFSWVTIGQQSTQTDNAAATTFGWLSTLIDYFSLQDIVSISAQDACKLASAVSLWLACIADIPQYMTYYREARTKLDWWLIAATGSLACSPLLYIIDGILSYISDRKLDVIVFIAYIIQIFGFWMFFVLVVGKVNDSLIESDVDLEAQILLFDSRWGEPLEHEVFTLDTEDK